MAATSKRGKVFWGFVLILGMIGVSVGALLYMLTRQVEIEFAQDPNPLEAHEASRKLNLLNEAREANRRGFVRLSEVEINSFLETRYKAEKNSRTNMPVQVVKTGVLLHQTNLTFVTWLKVPLFGRGLPFVWQRTVTPVRQEEKWVFQTDGMRLGRVEIPKALWARCTARLGLSDSMFEERRVWLGNLPKIALMKNEMSTAMEMRLYSYDPAEKAAP